MRRLIRTTDEARAAVAEVTKRQRGIVAFDIETMPMAGLEHYPGTTFDEAGEKIRPKVRDYFEYAQSRWAASFNPASLLRHAGLVVPRKVAGNEAAGLKASDAWRAFYAGLGATSDGVLNSCRWTVSDLRAAAAEWAAVPSGTKKVEKAAYEAAQRSLEGAEGALELLEAPLPLAILRHLVAVAVENRVQVDPVRPGLDPYTTDIFTIQVSISESETWVFNAQTVVLDALKPLFALPGVLYLAHNAKFDVKFLLAELDVSPPSVYCTLVGSRLLFLGLKMSHSLKEVARRFCGRDVDKAVRDTFIGVRREEPTPEQIDYGSFDTEVLFPIYAAQQKLAKARGQADLLAEFSQLSVATAIMEWRGYRIDTDRWLETAAAAAQRRDALASELERLLLPPTYTELFGDTPDAVGEVPDADADEETPVDCRPAALLRISQTKLVAERLAALMPKRVLKEAFPDVGISLGKIPRDNLDRVYRRHNGGVPHPFFHLYEEWAKAAKQASTYGRKFLWNRHPLSGAIHPNLTIAGTDTGRYTSTRPNLLNIPAGKSPNDPDYRAAFLAPGGELLLGADYDGMELRIAFNVTRDVTGQQMVASGKDGHSFTAAMAFHLVPASGVTEPRRRLAEFKYGTETLPITIFDIPATWSADRRS